MNRAHKHTRGFLLWVVAVMFCVGAKTVFADVPAIATLASPANGATRVATSCAFQWTSVAGAQAYYLYVGTSPGAKDLVDTGEIQATSYSASNLPAGQTLHATIWTELAGVWRPSPSSFTTAPRIATLTAPANGATGVAAPCTFQWTNVAGAQAYYLYVGTSPGAKDLVDTGEIQATSYSASNLPAGQTLYATIWTKLAGVWWPSMAGTQAYYLYVGTSPGAKDLINTGGLQAPSCSASSLSAGQTRYATIWTKPAGVWWPSQSSFTTAPAIATLTAPANGATGVDRSYVFQWTSVAGAQAYYLYVGTSPGAKDIVDSGEQQTTACWAFLPWRQTLYATIWTELAGVWWPNPSTFATATMVMPSSSSSPSAVSSMVFPAHGASNVDAGQPFQWTYSNCSDEYWLLIGTTSGGHDVFNSGPVHVPRCFVSNLPLGRMLYGRLFVLDGGTWSLADSFIFSAKTNTITTTTSIESAFWATNFVRHMADDNNGVLTGTLLKYVIYPDQYAVCSDYSKALMAVLAEMKLSLDTRILHVAFNPNGYDQHTLVELFNPDQQSWMLLDPTFDLTAKRSIDGAWAAAEDIMTATRNQMWNQITYVFLGEKGDSYARQYYIDYPLLYLNVYHWGAPIVPGQGPSVLPYYRKLSLPATDGGAYAIRSATQSPVTFVDTVDGNKLYSVDCNGVDSFSRLYKVGSVAVPDGGASFELYAPNRHVF